MKDKDKEKEKKKEKQNNPKDMELVKQKIEKTSYYFLKGLYDNRKQIFNNVLYLFVIPILIFLFGQLLCYGKIIFESGRMLFNFLFIYIVIAFFYSITGKLKPSLIISTLLIYIIGLINYFITTFRGTPLVPWDIFSVNVALTVLPTFKVTLTKELVGSFILLLISIIILFFGKAKDIRNKKVNISIRIISLILITIFFFNFYTTDLINAFDLDHNWDPKEEYHNNGLLASLFKQSKNLFISLPEGYSIEALKEIISETELSINEHLETITEKSNKNKKDEKIDNTIENTINTDLLDNTIQNIVTNESINLSVEENNDIENKNHPHIITIMNESLADLTVINNFKMSEDPLSYINSLEKNTIKGNTHVSVFGATTPNTEWEFLTSNSMAFVPYRTVPYQQYITRKSYSLATLLKEQGYSTYAMHSYYPQGYNRNIVYPLIGFDKFLHINNMKNVQYIREYPDDKSTYDNIISIFENKKENEKIFNFTLTMQNHGSYTDENFTNTIIAENGEYPKLNQYLSLIKESDNAFKYLLDYFKEYPEPVIILMFGDHQPYIEDEFYDKLLSSRFEDTESKEAKETKYITPYIIWTNYDYDYKSYNIPDISINYLSSLLLDVAEVDKSLYHEFLDNLREFVPVITGNGYTDVENNYYNFTDTTPFTNLIKQYNYLQYNNMFDKNNKLVELFTVNKD